MFSKSRTNSRKNPSKSAPGDNRSTSSAGPSIIGSDLTVRGDLKSKGEIQIDGAVEGNVNADSILVTREGNVQGDLKASAVTLHGRVKGSIIGGKVHLHPTSALDGEITYERITIDDGAQFSGQMNQSAQASPGVTAGLSAGDKPVAPVITANIVDVTAAKAAKL